MGRGEKAVRDLKNRSLGGCGRMRTSGPPVGQQDWVCGCGRCATVVSPAEGWGHAQPGFGGEGVPGQAPLPCTLGRGGGAEFLGPWRIKMRVLPRVWPL